MTSLAEFLSQPKLAKMQALKSFESKEFPTLIQWYYNTMTRSTNPLQEKIVLYLHGHFATAISKVRLPSLMLNQNQLFRNNYNNSFSDLVSAIGVDPAMMIWLDNDVNRAIDPNENYARELMELFTLGVGNYTEDDVRNAAKSFTGWTLSKTTGVAEFRPRLHDNSVKTFLGHTGNFGSSDIYSMILSTTDSAKFIVSSLFSHFAYPVSPSSAEVLSLVKNYTPTTPLTEVIKSIYLSEYFIDPPTGSGLIKQPIEYLVGIAKSLGIDPMTFSGMELRAISAGLGQIPFDPPNVGGWPQNAYFISTATAYIRLIVAKAFAHRTIGSSSSATTVIPEVMKNLGITTLSNSTSRAITNSQSTQEALTLLLISPEAITV